MSEAKVYIVSDGEYSDYHICGVFSTKAKAQEFIDSGGGGGIEEHILDVWRPNMGVWSFWIDINTGDIIRESRSSDLEEPTESTHASAWPDEQAIRIDVNHGDRERAVKISSEHFARIKLHWETAERLNRDNPYVGPEWFSRAAAGHLRGMQETLAIARVLSGLDPLPELPASIHGECVRMAILSGTKAGVA